jgi:hypothetical protein
LVAALTVEELREVVSAAVDRHDDAERLVRLVAARAAGDLAQLRAEVDRGLRTRWFSRLPGEHGLGAGVAARLADVADLGFVAPIGRSPGVISTTKRSACWTRLSKRYARIVY